MSNQPTSPDASKSATIPVERSPTFQHVFADQASCNWLGRDIDLSFYAFTENYQALPGPAAEQGRNDVPVSSIYSEMARVRLAPASAWHLLTNIIFTLINNDDLDPQAVKQEVDRIMAAARTGDKTSTSSATRSD